ncbi:MAG: molybdopterin-dependent oxidoreductase [Planctomycetaceae bacterium]|nr:molybdopterin-dependent oxidoreductase [Planctomycetaceae bacterium]
MTNPSNEHQMTTRRFFLELLAGGSSAVLLPKTLAARDLTNPALRRLIENLQYLTPSDQFGTVERGNPLPYKLPTADLKEAGLTKDSWKLEVVSDPAFPATMGKQFQHADNTAFSYAKLMELANKNSARFIKTMTCNNMEAPLGTGIWEGVPLRDVIWLTEPAANIRRVFYHGYHNLDPKQMFQSSLPIGRILEDPPGMPPVTLVYKLNGKPISGRRGGPVRLVVPETYGFKSVKWLTRITLTNLHHANDTYHRGNNDVDSWLKSIARFGSITGEVPQGTPIPITGLAQVGISGLKKVQVWITPSSPAQPREETRFAYGDWQDATILPPPTDWDANNTAGPINMQTVYGFDKQSGKPSNWPIPYTIAHWATLLPPVAPGRYTIRCRTIDNNNIAQPLPRPFKKSGNSSIARVSVVVGES